MNLNLEYDLVCMANEAPSLSISRSLSLAQYTISIYSCFGPAIHKAFLASFHTRLNAEITDIGKPQTMRSPAN